MKEIKIRVWNKDNGFGYLTISNRSIGCGWNNDPGTEFNLWTGLKDINGKDIYEGDILKVGNYEWHRIVKYKTFTESECAGHGDYRDETFIGFDLGDIRLNKVKVIGNIYENKDLLTEWDLEFNLD